MDLQDLGRAADPPLRFQLLGVPVWQSSSGETQPLSRKDAALVAILALDGPQARDVLAGKLWPAVSERRAAASLRQRVARLRRDTGHRVVHTGQSVWLGSGVVVDVMAVGALDAEALLELGDLLGGFDYGDNESINAWVATQRELLRRVRGDALVGHAHRLEARGELAAALRMSDRILSLMPLQEHAWRHQMRLHYLRGDRSSAVQAFERFEALLRDETGARPSEETLDLLRLIESAGRGPFDKRAIVPVSLVRPPRLVGRDHEWHAMTRAWSAGKAFLLVADAGMGKSRLLADYLRGRSGVLQAQGRPGDERTPYAVLSRLLESVCVEYPPAADAAAPGEPIPAAWWRGAASFDADRRGTHLQAVEAMLAGAQARGLSALVVDDLHHADHATVEALRWLSASQALAGLRFGLASRPPEDASLSRLLRDWLDDSHRPESIALPLLTMADIEELVDSLDLAELRFPGMGERLYRHAGGQPHFTLETLKDVLLQATDPARDPLPTPIAVHTLLQRRIDGLSESAVALLQVSAVAGAGLTVEQGSRMLGLRPLELARPWAELESANLLRGQRFVSHLVRECALSLLPLPVQRSVHASLAGGWAGQLPVVAVS